MRPEQWQLLGEGHRSPEGIARESVQERLDYLVLGFRNWGLPKGCLLKGTAERIGGEEKWDLVGRVGKF